MEILEKMFFKVEFTKWRSLWLNFLHFRNANRSSTDWQFLWFYLPGYCFWFFQDNFFWEETIFSLEILSCFRSILLKYSSKDELIRRIYADSSMSTFQYQLSARQCLQCVLNCGLQHIWSNFHRICICTRDINSNYFGTFCSSDRFLLINSGQANLQEVRQ